MGEISGPEAHQERVASLEARVEELLTTVAVLSTQVAELTHRDVAPPVPSVEGRAPAPAVDPDASTPPAPVADEPSRIDRRRLLFGGGAAAAAATAAALATSASPAAADNGNALTMGVSRPPMARGRKSKLKKTSVCWLPATVGRFRWIKRDPSAPWTGVGPRTEARWGRMGRCLGVGT